MGAPWSVRRTTRADATGQRRWDVAYQCLLQWSARPPGAEQRAGTARGEEDEDGRGLVRAGLDQAAAADPNH
jgi:hypothetical protein